MIKLNIVTEDEEVVTYDADTVMKTANDIMGLYTAEHERHRKQVGSIFNSNKADLDKLTKALDSEAQTYSKNIEQIRRQEEEQLSGQYGIHLMYQI